MLSRVENSRLGTLCEGLTSHMRLGGGMTNALRALSLVEMQSWSKFTSPLRLRDQQSKRIQDGCKVYVDHVSWSLELFKKTTYWR